MLDYFLLVSRDLLYIWQTMDWIEQSWTPHPTQYRSFRGRFSQIVGKLQKIPIKRGDGGY